MLATLAALMVVALPGVLAAPTQGEPADAAWTAVTAYAVSPGVGYQELTGDLGSGPVVVHVVRADLATPGVSLDLASGRKVASRHPVPDVLDPDAVVGVNGDFFDIRDTDAPLGVAVDQQRGLRNGVAYGWNDAFWLDRGGQAQIGPVTVTSRVPATADHPGVAVVGVNAPSVPPGAVGVYDRHFGTLRGRRVVDGQRRGVREVVVRDGRVVASRTRLPAILRVRGTVLVGRGAGGDQLARLRVGQQVRVASHTSERAAVVLTGSDYLLRGGRAVSNTSPDPHFVTGHYPRTAVGIDADTGEVLLVVVDGRSTASAGVTLPQLSDLMQRLGADDALNLDGGGSSTMVARGTDGALGVLNVPSDGHPRPVANGLEVTFDPPAG